MSPNNDFSRPIGAENFDVWKTHVCAALDGKHHLGYVKKADYDGFSEDESEDRRSDMSDVDVDSKSAEPVDVDSDAVDYEESDDELKPPPGSDEASGDESDTSIKRNDLPEIRPFNRRQVSQERKRVLKNTHVRLIKNLNTSYEIFTLICEKYEGAAFHGDPYFIQHDLMKIKYEEVSDLTEFFLKLENAMKAASKANESVMTEGQKSIYLFHSMPKPWKDDIRIWKGRRKYIPYEDLKQSIEGKVRDIQVQGHYTLLKGTPESTATKNGRARMASGPPAPRTEYDNNVYSYCNRPRHNIRYCRGLQKDLRDGRVKAGTVPPASFAFKGNSKRDHPYRNTKNRNRGRNGGNNNYKKDKHNNVGGSGRNDNPDKSRGYEHRKKRESNSDGDDSSDNRRKIYHQERHETGLIAVATSINPPLSLTAQANVEMDTTWTIDSGCTRHVTHEIQWFSDISASGDPSLSAEKTRSGLKVSDVLSWTSLTPKATRRR
ncbi:hypothetical protein PHPALM_29542 [Phytophthora palmivora]|uniref:Uncharacterized protein n=1 Tax=Phytophthora palmivora TaxID=4796 RepID=A0A2P4X7B7_9STRA|nr:hypothetical protein PHPALM_29542 [Phytophthora palmivora]